MGAAGQSDGSGGDGRPLDTDRERWTRSPGGLTGNLENAVCWAVAMVTGISAAELLRIQSEHLERPQRKIPILESMGGFWGSDAAVFIRFSRGLRPASRTPGLQNSWPEPLPPEGFQMVLFGDPHFSAEPWWALKGGEGSGLARS